MSDEHSSTSRQADQLRTDIANVESGLEVIMKQVARLPTRKESAPKATASEIGDPGEDERVRLKRPIDFFDGKAPGSPNFLDDGNGNGVHYPKPKFGEGDAAMTEPGSLSRRSLIAGTAGLAGAAALAPRGASAQASPPANAQLGTPASTITTPPRDWSPGHPSIYPDPDVIVVDPSFRQFAPGNSAVRRLWTGAQWAEGPAWSSQGQYLVFSDVTGNTQYRYIWEDGRVTAFRRPSNNTNGNSFDFEGRQLSCEDFNRRVVRWEHDGSLKVIADNFEGKPLNSPNDIVPHQDGSIWFTDPPYGDRLNEGHPDEAGGPTNPLGVLKPEVGAPNAGVIGGRKRELPTAVYRWDPSGKLEVAIPETQLPDPNGLCFSPDYKSLFVISTGQGPGDTGPGGKREVYAYDVQGTKVTNMRLFTDMMLDGIKCGPDGMRADVFGNLWISSNAPLGYAGVLCVTKEGKLIGRIRLPEVCANLAFGGPKRDRLFMAASTSLFVYQTTTQGAAPG